MGSGIILKKSIKKYGKQNHIFEILKFFSSREELIEKEKEIVNEDFLKDPQCMNLRIGGGTSYEHVHADEIRKKISSTVSIVRKGITFTEEHKQNMSNAKKGKKRPDLKNSKFTFEGRNHTKEAKDKIGESSKKRVWTSDSRDKVSKLKKGKYTGNQNSQFGKVWINNGEVNKKIKKEELEKFLENGWIRGSKRSLFKK